MTVIAPDAGPPPPQATSLLHVIADNPESLQDGLERAVLQLRKMVQAGDTRGILITRRSKSLFTVEASAEVPFGTTMERDRWRRNSAPRSAVEETTGH